MIRLLASLILTLGIVLGAMPVLAAEDSVTLIPAEGTEFEVNGRSYAGALTIAGFSEGLALTEATTVDRYLTGIKEVPFGWPQDALAAQVVAARTYLANTLRNGRSARGEEYGFDICASTACQVYAGIGYLDEPSGERWLAAVEGTGGEILTYDGQPILAVYSSSAGSRTMAVQDVWGGAPLPYLQPVDSPEEGVSPFASWEVQVPPRAFVDILSSDGHDVGGELLDLVHVVLPEGEGRATVRITTGGGATTVLASEIKGAMNRQGPSLYPDLLPGIRTDGKRLPQSLPSYNFAVSYTARSDFPRGLLAYLLPGDAARVGSVSFVGEGWGHNLGMSQYGALAMAQEGADYREILSHYYGGLTPEDAGSHLPDRVVVGLGWELNSVTVSASGRFELVADGLSVGPIAGGTWSVYLHDGELVLAPSIGYPAPADPGRTPIAF